MLDDLLDIFDRDRRHSSTRPPKRGLRGVLTRLLSEHDDDRRGQRPRPDSDHDDEMRRSDRSSRRHDRFDWDD